MANWSRVQEALQELGVPGQKEGRVQDARQYLTELATPGPSSLPDYTLHSGSHSDNVIFRLVELKATFGFSLGEYEAYLLAVSAYLHDLGMFFAEKELPNLEELRYCPDDKCDPISKYDVRKEMEASEQIRRLHHLLGVYMLEHDSRAKEVIEEDIRPYLFVICRGHRGADLKSVSCGCYTTKMFHGEKIRLGFLAALLRLADALDFDQERESQSVFESQAAAFLKSPSALARRIAHYFITSSSVERSEEGGNPSLRCVLRFAVPLTKINGRSYLDFLVTLFEGYRDKLNQDELNIDRYPLVFANELRIHSMKAVMEPATIVGVSELPERIVQAINKSECKNITAFLAQLAPAQLVQFPIDDNPFLNRAAIRAKEDFVGRKDITRKVLEAIRGGQCVSIVGPHRIGKTSFLFHIRDDDVLQSHGMDFSRWVMVYCTGQDRGGKEDLENYLLSRIQSETSLLSRYERLDQLAKDLVAKGLKVVLLLDEFEEFVTNTNTKQSFFIALRSLVEVNNALTLVTSSSVPLSELSRVPGSCLPARFFQRFREFSLGPFDPQEADDLVNFSQRAGITFSARTRKFIAEMAGLHPFFLQIACDRVFEWYKDRGSDAEWDNADYEILRRDIGKDLESHFTYTWERLDLASRSALCKLESVRGDPNYSQCLQELEKHGMIFYRRDRGHYDYMSGSLKEFVQRKNDAIKSELRSGTLLGRQLGVAQIQQKVGSGGMSTVYRGYQLSLGRTVAVKVLSLDAHHEDEFERLKEEAQALAQLDHTNILPIIDFGREGDLAYIVTKYIPGGTLADRISDGLSVETAIKIATQLAEALYYAHQNHIIHRDVKPGNVLMDTDGKPLLADFGLVKCLTAAKDLTMSDAFLGTPAYIAPEQAEGQVDFRSDIYSLGIVLYEMLTGRLPFEEKDGLKTIPKKLQEPPPPSFFTPDLPPAIEQIVLKAIAPRPEDRYQSALEMRDALRAISVVQ